MMDNPQEQILKLLSRIEAIINSEPQDLAWSKYNSIEEINVFLWSLKEKVSAGDKSITSQIIYITLPTGSFQEISVSSGWGNEFCKIATTLEEAVALWKK